MFEYSEFSIIVLSVFLGVGLVFLFWGGDALSKGAAGLALYMKVNPIIIGLTIVAMATSMPELVTSLYSAFQGAPGIAVGNIVGSNLANISLILGVSALILPLDVHARLIRKEMPVLMLATLAYWGMSYNGHLGRIEGAVLLLGQAGFLWMVIQSARKEKASVKAELKEEVMENAMGLGKCWLFIMIGAVLLHFGAEFLVNSSIQVASRLGMSEALIGLTIVAVGTSLPELAASIAAARRGHSDICVGNLVGSNIFNILFIGGSVSLISPLEVEKVMVMVDYPAMVLVTAVLWWMFMTGKKVTRAEGVGLIVLYFGAIVVSWVTKG